MTMQLVGFRSKTYRVSHMTEELRVTHRRQAWRQHQDDLLGPSFKSRIQWTAERWMERRARRRDAMPVDRVLVTLGDPTDYFTRNERLLTIEQRVVYRDADWHQTMGDRELSTHANAIDIAIPVLEPIPAPPPPAPPTIRERVRAWFDRRAWRLHDVLFPDCPGPRDEDDW
ncbi:MAG TPA: hypothetical protein VEW95_05495 [Candidatus Limnocylindrales bacterium]|nr:hypothetical protein [Candidatus Limnocylindrales bacterium]